VRIGVVVQARMGSTRLPGKVLLPLAGKPLLWRMVERVRAAQTRIEVIVATTVEPADDPIVDLCRSAGVACMRGHPTDLLDRHVAAARLVQAELVVKIPSDCPLIDPGCIDAVLSAWEPGLDFLSNLHPPTWPDGNDVEALPIDVLELAAREARQPHEREHTTPFVWDQPKRFRTRNVRWAGGRDYSKSHRFTIDWPEDYQLIAAIYDELHSPGRTFSLAEILALLERRPELLQLNARYAGVNWYRHHLGQLRTVGVDDTRIPEAR
jgi:spore coat polysaccharide biosynthesis protein SpsF